MPPSDVNKTPNLKTKAKVKTPTQDQGTKPQDQDPGQGIDPQDQDQGQDTDPQDQDQGQGIGLPDFQSRNTGDFFTIGAMPASLSVVTHCRPV